jgi:protein required for attachment to host cells
MKIPANAWVVIADGEKALFLQNTGTGVEPVLHLVEKDVLENPPTREQGTDRPGRLPGNGQGRSSVEQTDWHEFEKSLFARDVAKHLNHAAAKGAIDDLFLVAPPATLGALRLALDGEVSKRLRAEIEKDLTNHPVPGILAHLKDFDG